MEAFENLVVAGYLQFHVLDLGTAALVQGGNGWHGGIEVEGEVILGVQDAPGFVVDGSIYAENGD